MNMNNKTTLNLLEIRDTDERKQLVAQLPFDSQLSVRNFAVPQLKLVEFALLPRLIHNSESFGAPGNIMSVIINNNALTTWFPEIFNTYSYIRCDFRFTLVLTPTFNHTGLLALSYAPDNLLSVSRANHSLYPWYCIPSQRVFARVGVDNSVDLVVPWFGSVGALRPRIENDASITQMMHGATFSFMLRLDRMTQVAAAASAVQTVGMKLYMTPTNIEVGGFMGGLRT